MTPAKSFTYPFVLSTIFLGWQLGIIVGLIGLNACLKRVAREQTCSTVTENTDGELASH
jgi:hypothetical protein